jgi:hypothetical protein
LNFYLIEVFELIFMFNAIHVSALPELTDIVQPSLIGLMCQIREMDSQGMLLDSRFGWSPGIRQGID